jgi:hypothetical protein
MGNTQSKHLAARHGMCELAFTGHGSRHNSAVASAVLPMHSLLKVLTDMNIGL